MARRHDKLLSCQQFLYRRHNFYAAEYDNFFSIALVGGSAVAIEHLDISHEPSVGAEHSEPGLVPVVGAGFDAGLAHSAH